MGSATDERNEVVHRLSDKVSVIIVGVPMLREFLKDQPEALAIVDDLEAAAEACVPLFARLRKTL